MTSLMVASSSHPEMPGYKIEMDDVQTPSSEFNFYQSALATTGTFSFSSQTGPSSDPMSGSSWDTTGEGTQNFHQDFLETGSSHPGESEDFSFNLDGSMTPRGQSQSNALEDLQNKWTTIPTAAVAPPVGGEPMRRGISRTSTGSHKHRVTKPSSNKARMSHTSSSSRMPSAQLCTLDITGNVPVFGNGHQPSQMDAAQGFFMDAGASGVSSQMMYPGLTLDLGMDDGLPSPPTEMKMHVVPAHMHLDPDTSLTSNSPSASWTSSLNTPDSHLSSPAGSPDEAWLPDPLMASPPRSDNGSPSLQGQLNADNQPMGQDLISNDLSGPMIPVIGDDLMPGYPPRRSTNDGESARDHPLYKNATPGADGLFHCPWEGETCCNHKPEKLKCNYDKFVDSHLKPYRCKDPACETARFSSTACLLRHEREAHAMHGHGDKPFLCTYEGCDRAMPGNGFPRQWNLRDHMRRVHNDNRPPGSPAGAGTGAGAVQPQQTPSTKGRKRKDAPKGSAMTSRKASAKSNVVEAAPVAEAQPQKSLIEEWTAHRKALEDVLLDLSQQPWDPKNSSLLQEAQSRISSLHTLNVNTTSQQHGAHHVVTYGTAS